MAITKKKTGSTRVTAKKVSSKSEETEEKAVSKRVKKTVESEKTSRKRRAKKSVADDIPSQENVEKVSVETEKKVSRGRLPKTSDKVETSDLKGTPSKPRRRRSSKMIPVPTGKVVGRASLASLFGETETNFSEEPPEWVKPEWVKYYKNLYMLRRRLKNQMSGLADDSAQEVSSFGMHMADTGTDHFNRDFALSLLSADQDALYEVEQALKRIQKGTYGLCEMTGKPIPKTRLEAIPWTRFTVEAQAQLEKDGVLNKHRLGTLGTIANPLDELANRPLQEEDEEGEDKLAPDKE
jgi:RNA polymerase-binding transcription factor DksA